MHSAFPANTSLKLLSAFTAVILWLFVSLQKETEVSLKVPINTGNIPLGLTVANAPLPEIIVTVKGARYDMMIRKRDVKVLLDLSGVKEGMVAYPAIEDQIKLSSGLRVTRVYPSKVMIDIRKTIPTDKTQVEQ